MRKLQIVIGLLLAVVAFVAVLVVGRLTQPPRYEVVVVVKEVPAFTKLTPDVVAVDAWSMSPAVVAKYVLAADWERMLNEGAVAVENLHVGQPLLRVQVATGANAEKVSRLSVALSDPDRVIFSVPVNEENLPALIPGDVVALFYAAGNVSAQALVTQVVTAPPVTPTPTPITPTEITTETIELQMPVAKWIANGVVYRLNREKRENPNYGAPGMENEPRYIEGAVKSLDVVVRRADAEWVAFALAHGRVQVAVLPAVTRADVESGTFPPSAGVTWTDFEKRFFRERAVVER
ncbi:MAG: hypothetical protein QN194_16215 [Armatimonadota bacterium]|nr:hypothetical protein [Armatimonadota bacterium]